MKKCIFCLSLYIFVGCSSTKKINSDLKSEINSSIIDGFFDGDIEKITKNTYLLKD